MFGRKRDPEDAPVASRRVEDDPGTTRPIRSVGLDLDEQSSREPVDEPVDEPAGERGVDDDTAAVPAYAGDVPAEGAERPQPHLIPAAPSFGPAPQPDPGPARAPEPEPEPEPEPAAETEVAAETEPVAARELTPEERARRARSGRAVDDRPDPRKPSLLRASRAAVREFGRDQCTDMAAALTYYSVLSIFPAALAVLSVLGLVSDPERYVDKVLQVLGPLVNDSTIDSVRGPLESLANSNAAGFTLIGGVLLALFSASAYVGAFGRAMNRVLEVEEGRPVWKLRPTQVLVTVVTVVLVGVALVILVVSGPVAASVGSAFGLEGTVVNVWNIAKWPVLALIVIAVVGVLYRSTPNAKQDFRWLSPGAFVAIVVWLAASVGFAFYVAEFNSYDRTFGSIGVVVIALLWLWLTNLALLFGAELDSELERNRQLQAGLPAEASLQLPVRDDRTSRKRAAKQEEVVAGHRSVRESFLGGGQVADRPYR